MLKIGGNADVPRGYFGRRAPMRLLAIGVVWLLYACAPANIVEPIGQQTVPKRQDVQRHSTAAKEWQDVERHSTRAVERQDAASAATAAAMFADPTTKAGDGLQIPGLTPPDRVWSDVLWSKSEYLAWVQGRAHRTPAQAPEQISTFPSLSSATSVAPASGAFDYWDLGARSWNFSGSDGLAIRLGSGDVGTSVLSGSATLGGMHIRQQGRAPHDEEQPWKLALSLGALDQASGTGSGDLSYGPMAAHTVVQYGLDKNLALESALQVAPGMLTMSLGARVDAGVFGALRGGVAHGGVADQRGRRVQAVYDLALPDDWRLSVSNEWERPGFADLGHYDGGVGGGIRRRWAATVPTRNWGDISSTYETWQPVTGPEAQRLGFSQQFWYSPNLRIGLQAQRELASGDYDIGIRFSVPIN